MLLPFLQTLSQAEKQTRNKEREMGGGLIDQSSLYVIIFS